MTQVDERGSRVKVPELCVLEQKKRKGDLGDCGLQHQEISVNECAVCCGLYEDDIDEGGNIVSKLIQCTNAHCAVWSHTDCLEQCDGDYVCFMPNIVLIIIPECTIN